LGIFGLLAGYKTLCSWPSEA